jgi:hypothetical protein
VWNHRQVPKGVRLWWGGIKNLLCGVTTVCQHNPYEAEFDNPAFPVRVLKPYGWAHSLTMGQDVAGAFRATPPDAPFFIHLGEGVDTRSRNEVFKLDRLGCLNRRTVLIHAVGLDASGWQLVRARRFGGVVPFFEPVHPWPNDGRGRCRSQCTGGSRQRLASHQRRRLAG